MSEPFLTKADVMKLIERMENAQLYTSANDQKQVLRINLTKEKK